MVAIIKLIMIGIAIVCLVTLAFVVQDFVEDKVKNTSSKKINRVHFYVARDKDCSLWIYIGKPIRRESTFVSCWKEGGKCMGLDSDLRMYGLNENDYADITWEDEPVEVFVNMED